MSESESLHHDLEFENFSNVMQSDENDKSEPRLSSQASNMLPATFGVTSTSERSKVIISAN